MADKQQYDPQELLMQLRYLQNMYSQQYEVVENDIASYTIANSSMQRNLELLQGSNGIQNSNIIIGGEGGAYISAKISKVDKVMTYIGAGYLVEKSVEEASSFLMTNQQKSEEFLNRLISEKQKLERELLDISFKMNALQSQAQK